MRIFVVPKPMNDMKRYLITLVASLLGVAGALFLCSCGTQKAANNAAHHASIVGELPENINFSNSFRMFWDALVQDTKRVRSLDKYKPSDKLLENAAVSEHEGEYVVSGFLTTDDTFDEAAFVALGGTLNRIDSTTSIFKMPLKRLPDMWQVRGIVSVEAAQRVYLRKH